MSGETETRYKLHEECVAALLVLSVGFFVFPEEQCKVKHFYKIYESNIMPHPTDTNLLESWIFQYTQDFPLVNIHK